MNAARVPRFCHVCGQPLTGRFYRYAHGLVACSTCAATRPRCARCDAPLPDADLLPSATQPVRTVAPGAPGAGGSAGGPPVCRRCLRSAPRCACCGTPITQTWYTFEELLPPAAIRRFCERCVQHQPRCDVCRAPVPQGATTLADGQFRCGLCAAEMVLGSEAVRGVYAEALALAERAAQVRPRQVPALAIVGRRQMGEVRQRFASDIPPGAGGHHVLGFFVREHGTASIYVELGLPRPLLLGTLAHELGHAWQVEAAASVTDPLLREGFAEWVSHRVLVAGGHRRVAARATRRDDIYGRGLRHFLEIERAAGRPAVLDVARGVRSAPVQAPN
jgi:DNA-directed RNA polymerase subunit N (RpoN/RPB10)